MLNIDYLHINAHPRLPPTRSARGSVTIFTLPQGFRLRPAGYAETGTPWAIELTAPPVGGAQNSACLRTQSPGIRQKARQLTDNALSAILSESSLIFQFTRSLGLRVANSLACYAFTPAMLPPSSAPRLLLHHSSLIIHCLHFLVYTTRVYNPHHPYQYS